MSGVFREGRPSLKNPPTNAGAAPEGRGPPAKAESAFGAGGDQARGEGQAANERGDEREGQQRRARH